MVFHFVLHYVAVAAIALLADILLQFGVGECLLLTFRVYEVCRLHLYYGVSFGSACDMLAQSAQFANLPVRQSPVILRVGNGVVLKLGNDERTAKVNEIRAKAEAEGLYAKWYAEAEELAGASTAQDITYDDNGNVAN